MSENPNALIAEADRVAEDCVSYLATAEELVVGIPRRREAALERIAAAKERDRQAHERYHRVIDADEVEKWEEREAELETHRTTWAVYYAEDQLGSDDLDPENRKAVARQLAAMIREDAEQRLRAIAARSDDPEVRRVVAERRDEVATSTRYLIRSFAEARRLEHNEVRTTRAEAHAILDRLKNPPVDPSAES